MRPFTLKNPQVRLEAVPPIESAPAMQSRSYTSGFNSSQQTAHAQTHFYLASSGTLHAACQKSF